MKIRITDLDIGRKATVVGFDNFDHNTERLMQMGLVEDTIVQVIRLAPTGDPVEVLVDNYSLSVRRADAELILVEPSSTQ